MIADREYKSWNLVDPDTYVPVREEESKQIIPSELKLFTNDLISICPPKLIHSPTRTMQIPAILVLEGNKTYGRTKNNKRLLYKCIPNDRYLPAFLVPYAPEIGFSKITQNRFVVFQFDYWDGIHPCGMLVENLGEVGNLSAFYEYQLYCRSLHNSITEFNKAAKTVVQKTAVDHLFAEAIATERSRIFSIDPSGATDQDDAFSIEYLSPTRRRVRVYIANVFVCLERLNMWKSFSNRVSTIYLPDFKRPMMPTILSENTCSLTEGKNRPALCMETEVDLESKTVDSEKTRFFVETIKVDKNYAYETRNLLEDRDYKQLLHCTRMLDNSVEDSSDVVSFWMIQMNETCGEMMEKRGTGIFRQASFHPDTKLSEEPITMKDMIDSLPEKLAASSKRLIANWKRSTGQYSVFNKDRPIEHATMGKQAYVHITSPIRRIVDLLNQIIFHREFALIENISSDAMVFVEHWLGQLDYINTTMRSIKKVQLDCDMIHRCVSHPEWIDRNHNGVVFDRIRKTDGMYSYMVHLTELNILGRITTQEKYDNYDLLNIRIFLFQDEELLHRKIRLTVVDE